MYPHCIIKHRLDCAIVVMYYMQELYAGHLLNGDVNSNVICEMRAHVAEVFTDFMKDPPAMLTENASEGEGFKSGVNDSNADKDA